MTCEAAATAGACCELDVLDQVLSALSSGPMEGLGFRVEGLGFRVDHLSSRWIWAGGRGAIELLRKRRPQDTRKAFFAAASAGVKWNVQCFNVRWSGQVPSARPLFPAAPHRGVWEHDSLGPHRPPQKGLHGALAVLASCGALRILTTDTVPGPQWAAKGTNVVSWLVWTPPIMKSFPKIILRGCAHGRAAQAETRGEQIRQGFIV